MGPMVQWLVLWTLNPVVQVQILVGPCFVFGPYLNSTSSLQPSLLFIQILAPKFISDTPTSHLLSPVSAVTQPKDSLALAGRNFFLGDGRGGGVLGGRGFKRKCTQKAPKLAGTGNL